MTKGTIDTDKMACSNCGKPLSIKHDSVSTDTDFYVLCKFCHEKMSIIPTIHRYVPFKETK